MGLFKENTKMADIIHGNYLLLPVINRFGIRLGFKDKTVKDVCLEKDIDLQFFLAIINAFNSPEYFPEAELRSFSAVYIIDYLRKSHNYFINTSLPKIERLLDEFVKSSESADLNLIRTFYTKYKTELIEHIHDEEENTFPYVLELQKAYDDINPVPEHLSEYSIESFEKEHTNVDEKLFDLKNIIIKFLDPTYAVRQCNEFLFELFNFERELRDHARIEDQILVPKVMKMEDEIKSAI